MKSIQNIFWNSGEARLRSGYRVVLIILLMAIVGTAISLIFGPNHKMGAEAPHWYILFRALSGFITVFLSVWIAGRFLDKRVFADFGFHFNKNWWVDFSFGALLGILLMSGIFIFEYSAGWITISGMYYTSQPENSFIVPVIFFFLLFISVGITEELLTRGYLLTNIAEGINSKSISENSAVLIALIITSVMFGLFHAGNPEVTNVAVLNIAFAGFLLGSAFILTGRLAIPIGLHITWNFFQGPVFGFPVSGQRASDIASVFAIEQDGPEFWTGGAFGPEAGMLGLIAIVLGILIILAWTYWREGKISIYTPIGLPPRKAEYNLDFEIPE